MARNLSQQEEAFCIAFVNNNGKRKDAALEAGYAESAAGVSASRLLQRSHVLDRIDQLNKQRFRALGPGLMAGMVTLAEKAKSEKVRHDSLKDLLDRAGYKPIEQVLNLESSSIEDVAALKERAKELLKAIDKKESAVAEYRGKDGEMDSGTGSGIGNPTTTHTDGTNAGTLGSATGSSEKVH
jgi:phage terminase small subunit